MHIENTKNILRNLSLAGTYFSSSDNVYITKVTQNIQPLSSFPQTVSKINTNLVRVNKSLRVHQKFHKLDFQLKLLAFLITPCLSLLIFRTFRAPFPYTLTLSTIRLHLSQTSRTNYISLKIIANVTKNSTNKNGVFMESPISPSLAEIFTNLFD